MPDQPDTTVAPTSGEKPSLVAAVFDVDRTLVPVTTTERIFIRYLARHGAIGLATIARTLVFMVRNLRYMTPYEALRRQRAYLAGQSYEKMSRLARKCFETDIKPRISRAGLAAMHEHKNRGETVILLSG